MKGFVRLFPLGWVVFPGEILNLHIFEPRYIQLISECLKEGSFFGIPFYKDKVQNIGTLVEIESVNSTFPNGELDISVRGKEPFEILSFQPIVPDKLYPGGIIKSIPFGYDFDVSEAEKLKKLIRQFFDLIGSRPKISDENLEDLSFSFGHKLGLVPEKELDLLRLAEEHERQDYLIRFLEDLLPALRNAELAKGRILQNGHHKSFDPLQF